ncbi:MAG: reductive dehalogenase [Dehalogenimonas sp.]
MSKFHSTLTRRAFMKALGLGAATVGGASLVAPVYHDIDELTSSSTELRKRAWWVKEVEEPTVDIDWDIMKRHHSFHSTQSGAINARYLGLDEYTKLLAQATAAKKEQILRDEAGLTLRDQALNLASRGIGFTALDTDKFIDKRLAAIQTPADLGVPRWEGTPEENLKMMEAAMHHFGASNIGAAALEGNHQKLLATHGRQSIAQTYFPYEGKTTWPPTETFVQPMKLVSDSKFSYDVATQTTSLPDHGVYTLSYTVPQSHEAFRTTPNSAIFSAANITRYRLRENIRACTQMFVRGLGYQHMNDEPYGAMPGIAGAVLTGLVENGRHTIMGISPEHGSTVGLFELYSDLPMAHTKPIDAGIWRFCQSCGICAEHCPSASIEPKGGREISYEPYASSVNPKHPPLPGWGFNPVGEGEAEYYKLGRKTYWSDGITCAAFRAPLSNGCMLCFGVCVFNSQYGALVHDLVRGTLATTGIFNGFFAQMDTTFGFGLKQGEAKEEWWDMSLPSYGYSTALGAKHGGYK